MTSDELSSPATKGDIVRMHEKLDTVVTAVAVLTKTMPVQPCKDHIALEKRFNEHEAAVKEVKGDIRKAIINNLVRLAMAASLFYVGTQFRSPNTEEVKCPSTVTNANAEKQPNTPGQ